MHQFKIPTGLGLSVVEEAKSIENRTPNQVVNFHLFVFCDSNEMKTNVLDIHHFWAQILWTIFVGGTSL